MGAFPWKPNLRFGLGTDYVVIPVRPDVPSSAAVRAEPLGEPEAEPAVDEPAFEEPVVDEPVGDEFAAGEPGEAPPLRETAEAPEPAAEPAPSAEPEARAEQSGSDPGLTPPGDLPAPSGPSPEPAAEARAEQSGSDPGLTPPGDLPAPPEPSPEPAPAPKKPLLQRELRLPRPRRHRATRVVGLRVGSSQLAAAHVRTNGAVELVQLARTDLEPGLVVGGEVRDPDALAAALKAFFSANKLPRRNVRLGIANGRIGVRVLDVPPIDDPKQLENAIRFRAHEAIPIPVTEAVIDHVAIGEGVDEEGAPVRRVLVAFAHRDLVARHVDVCRRAGLKLLGVDLDGFALLRSLAEPRGDGEAAHAVVAVSIGHDRTVFAVSDGEVCDFTRVLEWGGASLDVALARALDLAPSQAAAVKHGLSLVDDAASAGLSPVQVEAARAAVRQEIDALARELVSSLRFYQSREGSLDIGEILVTGGGSQLHGLLEELERLIGAPVRAGDPLGRVVLGKKVHRPAEAGSYAIAVGLGMER
ncbi:MAG TPA: type IV pilus assembly protein PilM [Gaiellaceae bacterium]|nr:type IV pilus assembly protein PilM [Gaiellaceae bacterium]